MRKIFRIIILAFLLFSQFHLSAQNFQWAKSGGGNGCEAWLVTTDLHNNVYASGYGEYDSITFGPYIFTNFSSAPKAQSAIVKYGPSGNLLWAAATLNHSMSTPTGIATDSSMNVYLYGIFYSDTLQIGAATALKAPGHNIDYFLTKFDSNGNVLWIKTGGDASYRVLSLAGAGALACDGANIYIAGAFDSATCQVGGFTLTNSNPGRDDIFIAKYNSAGNVVWAKQFGGNGDDAPHALSLTSSGQIYLSGNFNSPSLAFGNTLLTNTSVRSVFVSRLDPVGNIIWAESAPGGDLLTISSAVDDSNNIYITGQFDTSITFGAYTLVSNQLETGFFVKYDANGNVSWAKDVTQVTSLFFTGTSIYSVSTDACNNIWIAGSLADITYLNGQLVLLPPSSIDPMFIAKYNTSGNLLSYFTLNCGGDDNVGIANDKLGNLFISGDYFQNMIFGNDTLFTSENEIIFVAKYAIPSLDSTFRNDSTCIQNGTVLYAPSGYPAYMWNDGSTKPFLNINTSGTFWVRCISTCTMPTLTDTIKVENFTAFSLGADTTLCGGSLILKVPVTATSYLWQDGSTANTFTVTASGTYYLTAKEQLCAYSDTISINVINLQGHNSDTVICAENPVPLILQANTLAGTLVSWNNNSTSPTITVKDTGIYWYTISENHCSTTDTIFVNPVLCDCWFEFPNAFTPNNDGKNDVFNIILQPSCTISNYKLSIYNRWGQQVFTTQNPSQGWNGKLNGVDGEIGAYYYYAEFNAGTQNIKHTRKGDITLVR